jgi:hypothetical protein
MTTTRTVAALALASTVILSISACAGNVTARSASQSAAPSAALSVGAVPGASLSPYALARMYDVPNAPSIIASPRSRLITVDEMGTAATAYDAVRRVRPNFLYTRGSREDVVVYLDGVRLGGVEMLYALRPSELALIRHLDASTATTWYGSGHTAGAILLYSRRGKR